MGIIKKNSDSVEDFILLLQCLFLLAKILSRIARMDTGAGIGRKGTGRHALNEADGERSTRRAKDIDRSTEGEPPNAQK